MAPPIIHSSWNHNENFKYAHSQSILCSSHGIDIIIMHRIKMCRVRDYSGRGEVCRLHVEASLHFGCRTLQGPLQTSTRNHTSFSADCLWDEELEFKASIQDIPKVTCATIINHACSTLLKMGPECLSVFHGNASMLPQKHSNLSFKQCIEPSDRWGPAIFVVFCGLLFCASCFLIYLSAF